MRRPLARATADEDESSIDITPMLDVVFIMLIFFIVTATFVKEAGIDVNRPDAATAVKQEHANILVAISADNEIWIDRRQVDMVVIQADKDSRTDTLIKVMDAARSAGVFNIAIAAQEP
jgi:biopolymer transport protein ExbD